MFIITYAEIFMANGKTGGLFWRHRLCGYGTEGSAAPEYPGDDAVMTMILEMANRGKNLNLGRKRVGWRWLWS